MLWHKFGTKAKQLGMRGLDEFERLQSEMERILYDIKRPFVSGFPALNVYTNEDGAVVSAELPGVSIEDVDIHVTGNTVTIKGERYPDNEEAVYYRSERDNGGFTRSIDLPFKINQDKVEANLNLGILYIKLPRAEEDKPRKIQVTAG